MKLLCEVSAILSKGVVPVFSAEQMRTVEKNMVGNGIAGATLMGLAGKGCVDKIMELYPTETYFTIFCGKGNNGGDGFCIAWFLFRLGAAVQIVFVGEACNLSPESQGYYHYCANQKIPILSLSAKNLENLENPTQQIKTFLTKGVVIDALLGIGVSGEPRGVLTGLISTINESDRKVVSIDIPSGLPTEGAIENNLHCIQADATLAIGFFKPSHVTYPGRGRCGDLFLIDIGFPKKFDEPLSLGVFTEEAASLAIHGKRARTANKYSEGHVLVVGGMSGYEGAGLITATGAFQAGAGTVTLYTSGKSRAIVAGMIPELITVSMHAVSVKDLIETRGVTSVVCGNGLGRCETARELILNTLSGVLSSSKIIPIVLDADALYHLSLSDEVKELLSALAAKGCEIFLTPHFKEGSRLLGVPTERIECDPIFFAKQIASTYHSTVILKGAVSVIAGENRTLLNSNSSPSLATAGSGDLLAGILGGILGKYDVSIKQPRSVALSYSSASANSCGNFSAADGLSTSGLETASVTVAALADHIHSKAAILATEKKRSTYLVTSEIANSVSEAITSLQS